MSPTLSAARRAEVRMEVLTNRLKMIVAAAALAIVALAGATLYMTMQAVQQSSRAADAAVAQSKTNEALLRSMKIGDERRTEILAQVKHLNVEQLARFQALLDTLYGPGNATLGTPASSDIVVPAPAATEPAPPRRSSAPAPKPKPKPKPKPTRPPPPSPPPMLPLPALPPIPSPPDPLCRLLWTC